MFPFSAAMHMDVAQQGYVGARVEERVRSGSDIKTEETEVDPTLRWDVIWHGGEDHFVALYQPRFIYTSSWEEVLPDPRLVNRETVNTGDPNKTPLSALHNGGVGFEAVRQRWRLSLYQFLAYGPISTSALLIQKPWDGLGLPPDPNPIIPSIIAARFNLLFVQTQLFVPIKLSARTALIPGFVYNAFGGADAASRGVIAMSQGPGASLALDHAASRSDRLVTTVGAGIVSTTFEDEREGATIYRAEAKQSWQHFYSKNLSSDLVLGGSVGGDNFNGYTLFSIASAAMLWDSWGQPRVPPGAAPFGGDEGHGSRLQLGVVAKADPWIDIFSGDLEQRAVVSVAANESVGRVTVRGAVSYGKVLNIPRSIAEYEIALAEGSVIYRFAPTFSVDAGVRTGHQSFDNSIRQNEVTQFTAFAGLSWAPLPARF
jgi:hypothetical protein